MFLWMNKLHLRDAIWENNKPRIFIFLFVCQRLRKPRGKNGNRLMARHLQVIVTLEKRAPPVLQTWNFINMMSRWQIFFMWCYRKFLQKKVLTKHFVFDIKVYIWFFNESWGKSVAHFWEMKFEFAKEKKQRLTSIKEIKKFVKWINLTDINIFPGGESYEKKIISVC